MTFEDTLTNFLLEPEAMHELIDAICEYRLTYMKLICRASPSGLHRLPR